LCQIDQQRFGLPTPCLWPNNAYNHRRKYRSATAYTFNRYIFPSPKKKVLQTAVALCQQALREGSGTVSCLFFFHLAAEHLSVREQSGRFTSIH
jgi:hypothetical protein